MSVRGRLPGGCFGFAQHNPSLSPASSTAGAAYQSFSDLSCCGVIVVNSAVLMDTLAHHSHEGKAPLGPDFDSIGKAGPPSRRGLTLLWSVRDGSEEWTNPTQALVAGSGAALSGQVSFA